MDIRRSQKRRKRRYPSFEQEKDALFWKKLILQGQMPEYQGGERERDQKKSHFGKEHLRADCLGM